jgi:hypothetical protein
MKTLLAGLFALGALLIGFAPSGVDASTGYSPAGIIRHTTLAPTHSNGTHVVKAAGTYNCGTITCDAFHTGVNGFFTDVGAASGTGSNVYSVDTQYYDGTGNIAYTENLAGTYVDGKSFPTNGCSSLYATTCITEAQLVAEIESVKTTNGWTSSSSNLFVILLPNGVDTCIDGVQNLCSSNYFCAYHDNSSSLIFAVEPFQPEWHCSGNGQGYPNGKEIDETANTLSHEQNEAITDPYPEDTGGWWTNDTNEYEIGDLCAWEFGANLGSTPGGEPYNQVINGHDYSLQLEYSNAANSNAGGCVSHLGGAVSPTTYGSGPLAYQGGTVMRTNHVYTIYWLPAPAPAISTSPIVTGTTAVGKQLSTTNGTWTNLPTGYAYKWQRCSSVGANCFDINGATSSTYLLTNADAGHELRSEVLASNGAGDAAGGYTPSALTGVIAGKPAVIAKPKISGVKKVGNSLSVSTGTWTYTPTSYGYQWLRCTSMGTLCKKVGGATNSTYPLSSADRGHVLEAKVTGTNAAGSTTVTTAKTGLIKS